LGPDALLQHGVVTGDFALERKLFGNPPHCRVKEKGCLDEALGQVRPVIAPPRVGQLMAQDVPCLPEAGLLGGLGWEDNYRVNKSQEDGGSVALRHLEPDGSVHCQF